MKIIVAISEMQSLADSFRKSDKTVGFVPTMGFLHDGHLSLMRKAREENDIVVVSIFVNPTQFGQNEDFGRYPRDAEGDRTKCEAARVDVLFVPTVGEMYPEAPSVFVTADSISDVLEGAIRPGHFKGVATIVAKLFNIVKPHTAYFGQKDYQQCVIVKRMAKGLNQNVNVKVMPTIRETDGLAMSSRNSYLNNEERRAATIIYKAMHSAFDMFRAGERRSETLKRTMESLLRAEPGIDIDYVEFADPDTLVPLATIDRTIVVLVAIRIGRTRLIDNLLLV